MAKPRTSKIVLITGASRGIGRADALLLAREGVRLALTYFTDKQSGEAAANECLKLGAPEVLLLKLDTLDNKSIRAAAAKVARTFGHIDALINNAGIIVWKPLEKQSVEEIETQLRTNLEGVIKVTKAFLPCTKEMVINMASAASLAGYPDMISYCASKWGVRGFTQALAKGYPRLVILDVISGGVATRMKNFRGMPPETVSRVIVDFIMGRKRLPSGSDINIRDYLGHPMSKGHRMS